MGTRRRRRRRKNLKKRAFFFCCITSVTYNWEKRERERKCVQSSTSMPVKNIYLAVEVHKETRMTGNEDTIAVALFKRCKSNGINYDSFMANRNNWNFSNSSPPSHRNRIVSHFDLCDSWCFFLLFLFCVCVHFFCRVSLIKSTLCIFTKAYGYVFISMGSSSHTMCHNWITK